MELFHRLIATGAATSALVLALKNTMVDEWSQLGADGSYLYGLLADSVLLTSRFPGGSPVM